MTKQMVSFNMNVAWDQFVEVRSRIYDDDVEGENDISHEEYGIGHHKVGDVRFSISAIFNFHKHEHKYGIYVNVFTEPPGSKVPISGRACIEFDVAISTHRKEDVWFHNSCVECGGTFLMRSMSLPDVLALSGTVFSFEVSGNFSLAPTSYCNEASWRGMWSLWRDRDSFHDFKLVASGGKELPCHKAVLAGASPVMRGLLLTDMEEMRQGFDNIDESEDVLRALLQYMYIQSLPSHLDPNLLLGLVRKADYYQVAGLMEMCMSRLLPLMSVDNCTDILNTLERFRHVDQACERAFSEAREMVKQDDSLLDQLILAAGSHKHIVIECAHAGNEYKVQPEQFQSTYAQPCRDDQSLAVWVEGICVSDADSVSQRDSKARQERCETGPGHAKSGSSDPSDSADSEKKSLAKGGEADSHEHGNSDGLAHIEIEGLAADPMPDKEFPGESSGAAAAAPVSDERRQGSRKRTHRGKSGGKSRRERKANQYQDQMSIPETHNSWD